MGYTLGRSPRITCQGQCHIGTVLSQLGASSACRKQGNGHHLRDAREAWAKAASVVVAARGGQGDAGGWWEEATPEMLGEGSP